MQNNKSGKPMNDITICTNHKTNGCKLSDKCGRVPTGKFNKKKAKNFTPWNNGTECNSFYRIDTLEDVLESQNEERIEARKERFGS